MRWRTGCRKHQGQEMCGVPGGQLQLRTQPRSARGGGWGTAGTPQAPRTLGKSYFSKPSREDRERPRDAASAGARACGWEDARRLPRGFAPVVSSLAAVAPLTRCPFHFPNWLSLRFSKNHSNCRNGYSGICSQHHEGNLTVFPPHYPA